MKSKLKDVELVEIDIKDKKYWAAEHPLFKGYWPTTCGNVISTNSSYNGMGESKRACSKPKLLAPQDNTADKYLRISVCSERGRSKQLVHRLVAQTYLEAPDDDLRDWDTPRPREHVNHIDGNPRNNKVTILEWTCPKENKEHSQLLKAIKEEVRELYA
jgi:hypothetical protein